MNVFLELGTPRLAPGDKPPELIRLQVGGPRAEVLHGRPNGVQVRVAGLVDQAVVVPVVR